MPGKSFVEKLKAHPIWSFFLFIGALAGAFLSIRAAVVTADEFVVSHYEHDEWTENHEILVHKDIAEANEELATAITTLTNAIKETDKKSTCRDLRRERYDTEDDIIRFRKDGEYEMARDKERTLDKTKARYSTNQCNTLIYQ